MKRKIFYIFILTLVKMLNICECQEIKGCLFNGFYFYDDFFSPYYGYSVKLICGNSSYDYNKNECNYKFESDKSEVSEFNTGDCKGNRLQDFITQPFINLNNLNISFFGVEQLTPDDLKYNNLTTLNASNNKLKIISSSLFINNHLSVDSSRFII